MPFLLLAAGSVAAQQPAAGRHRVWEASVQEAIAAARRGDAPAARSLLLAAIREAVYFPDSDPRTQRTLETLDAVQQAVHASGGPSAVKRLLDEVDSLAVSASPRGMLINLDARTRMAWLALRTGRSEDAEKLASATLASAVRSYGAEHPISGRLRSFHVLAIAARDPRRSVGVAQRYVEDARRSAGEGSPLFADALISLVGAYQQARWPERAIPHAERGLGIQEQVLGRGAGSSLATRDQLAHLYLEAGRAADVRRAVEALRPWVAQNVERAVQLEGLLAEAALKAGDLQASRDALGRAQQVGSALQPDAPERTMLRLLDASLLEVQGELDVAARRLDQLLEDLVVHGPGNEFAVASTRKALARIEERRGNVERVEELLKPVLGRENEGFLEERVVALDGLASTYARHGRADEALPLAQRALSLLTQRYGADNPILARALDTLARAQFEEGQLADAQATFERALALRAKRPDSVATELETWRNYAMLAKRLGDDTALQRADREIAQRSALLERKDARKELERLRTPLDVEQTEI